MRCDAMQCIRWTVPTSILSIAAVAMQDTWYETFGGSARYSSWRALSEGELEGDLRGEMVGVFL